MASVPGTAAWLAFGRRRLEAEAFEFLAGGRADAQAEFPGAGILCDFEEHGVPALAEGDDGFEFAGNRRAAAVGLGNALPPLSQSLWPSSVPNSMRAA